MASTGPLDRVIAAKLAAALDPLLYNVTGPVIQVGRPLRLTYPAGVDLVVADRLSESLLASSNAKTLVFVVELCQRRWLDGELDRLVGSLPSDGRVLFAEPVAGSGPGRVVQWLTGSFSEKRWGYSFDRDIPAELRAAGLTLTSVDRIFVDPMPTACTFAAGDARFYD